MEIRGHGRIAGGAVEAPSARPRRRRRSARRVLLNGGVRRPVKAFAVRGVGLDELPSLSLPLSRTRFHTDRGKLDGPEARRQTGTFQVGGGGEISPAACLGAIMSLEHVFYVSQSIAAVAVIASLLYLAQQVRQAERVQRATMQQGRADRTSHASLTVASSELVRVLQKGMAGDTDLTREEFTQWMWMCRALFLSGEDSLLQHEAGMLSDAAFDSYVAGVKFYFSMPGMRATWKLLESQFGSDFRAFGSAMLAQTKATSQNADAYAAWRKLLAAELGTSE